MLIATRLNFLLRLGLYCTLSAVQVLQLAVSLQVRIYVYPLFLALLG